MLRTLHPGTPAPPHVPVTLLSSVPAQLVAWETLLTCPESRSGCCKGQPLAGPFTRFCPRSCWDTVCLQGPCPSPVWAHVSPGSASRGFPIALLCAPAG